MAKTIDVDVVSAEESIYTGSAAAVFAPAELGEVGIYPRHSPLVTRLEPGEVRVDTPDGEEHHIYVSGGILEVQPHIVTILADTAIRAKDIDEAAAEAAKSRAEEAIANMKSDIDYARARSELLQALAQLRTLQRLRQGIRTM